MPQLGRQRLIIEFSLGRSVAFPVARVVPRTEPPHPDTGQQFDFQSPAGSLARWLRPDIGAFPARRGHLLADLSRVAVWRERIARIGDGLKVGFCWRSSNLQGERASKERPPSTHQASASGAGPIGLLPTTRSNGVRARASCAWSPRASSRLPRPARLSCRARDGK